MPKTYDELNKEIADAEKAREGWIAQVSAADKLRNRLQSELRKVDLQLKLLYQERNGQKRLF